jgi:hypothetical protein
MNSVSNFKNDSLANYNHFIIFIEPNNEIYNKSEFRLKLHTYKETWLGYFRLSQLDNQQYYKLTLRCQTNLCPKTIP